MNKILLSVVLALPFSSVLADLCRPVTPEFDGMIGRVSAAASYSRDYKPFSVVTEHEEDFTELRDVVLHTLISANEKPALMSKDATIAAATVELATFEGLYFRVIPTMTRHLVETVSVVLSDDPYLVINHTYGFSLESGSNAIDVLRRWHGLKNAERKPTECVSALSPQYQL